MNNLLGLVLLSSLLFFACNQTSEPVETEVEPITETESNNIEVDVLSENISSAHLKLVPALFKLKMEGTDNVVLLDIRTKEEIEESGSIEGAINLDYYGNQFEATVNEFDKEVPVMLFCRSGGRSGEAASLLKELGFKQVYDLNGGFEAWLQEGY